MRVFDLMTHHISNLSTENTLEQGIKALRNARVDGLPVVDENGKLFGIFTKASAFDAYLSGAATSEKLDDYCYREVKTVHADLPFEIIKERISKIDVGMGIVVGDRDNPLGIFDKKNLISGFYQEFKQLQNQFDSLFNNSFCGIIVVNNNKKINKINKFGETILSLSESIINSSFNDIFPNIDLNPVLVDSLNFTNSKMSMNGVDVLCDIEPLKVDGKVSGAIITFQSLAKYNEFVTNKLEDVKRICRSLLTVLNIAYEGIIVVDERGKVLYVNEAFCRFVGMHETELSNKSVKQLMIGPNLIKTLETCMAETYNIQINSKNGNPYLVSTIPIIKYGKIIGAVGRITYEQIEETQEISERLSKFNKTVPKDHNTIDRSEYVTFSDFITLNPDMCRIKEEAALVAKNNSTILITGESGTGKEVFAAAIHNVSPRRKKPFIKINCAAIPEHLLESEFFGYAPGSFTGANKAGKPGKFAAANGGTLFLDEIGDMPLSLQSKLLRVLQDKCFEPIGSNDTVTVDVRIIAATNQNLLSKVGTKEFRQDLYYRLNVINFELYPLRQRCEDIIPLLHVFIDKFNKQNGTQIEGFSDEIRNFCLTYDWPGNVRELENMVERAANFAMGNVIELKNISPDLLEKKSSTIIKHEYNNTTSFSHREKGLSKDKILGILNEVNWNKSEAARILGVSRTWLYEIIHRYNIH